ncbi:MAG: AAA family ATPase [Inconstantimicrobium porci]|uniref:ATP-dependent nuclease n=1 Tax=Inconstantimicrobium porci TaxID=2652291 RepID=UPI002A9162F7|nr:AAA family ATPase [Inconstantimicrobium porci]MDY5912610.1 AAA family ATPase [Inconstantimicrobium porci]
MKIKELHIENFRNLDGLTVDFSLSINYIIGENNIGKSNLLYCLNKVFNGKSFEKDDFKDENKSIKIKFTLSITDNEIGIFADLTDPNNANCVNIYGCQENCDEYLKFYHCESDEPISNSLIKKINIISYDSLRNPKNELDFSKTKGAGLFLNYIINDYIDKKDDNKSYLKKGAVSDLKKHTSKVLDKLSVFERFKICPQIEEDSKGLLSRILMLKDSNNMELSKTGYGVQFNMLIILSILEKIINFAKKRNDENIFSTILIFDEPEIHLYPYLQRTLVKDISRIANGEDENFNKLLKELFNIEKIDGQVIIATHSPNIIENDYKKIVRLYKNGNSVSGVSGNIVELNSKDEKQLNMQFEYVKEAIFAKSVIIVEGESEFGCFNEFAQKMEIDFDRSAIALIKANGANSVIPLMNMFDAFGIKCVGVIDLDKKSETQAELFEDRYYTKSKCFDSEIVEHLISKEKYDKLEKIQSMFDEKGVERIIQKSKLEQIVKKFDYKNVPIIKDYKFNELTAGSDLYKVMYVAWFDLNKGILLGKIIGNVLDEDEIPCCYRHAIKKVKELAEINE